MRLPTERTFVLSALAFTGAGLLCAAALARALTIDPIGPADATTVDAAAAPLAPNEPPPDAETARVPSETVLPLDALALAVDQDPFQPDRRRPEAYRLPGEEVDVEAPVRRTPTPPPFQVIGTAVSGRAGLAIIQAGDDPPRVVSVGESVSGFRLLHVEDDAATVMGDGETVRLAVETASARQASNAGRRGALTETRNRQLGEMLQQLQQRGLPAEFIDQLMRQQGRGRGDFEARPNVIIRGSDGDVMMLRADSAAVTRGRGRGGQ